MMRARALPIASPNPLPPLPPLAICRLRLVGDRETGSRPLPPEVVRTILEDRAVRWQESFAVSLLRCGSCGAQRRLGSADLGILVAAGVKVFFAWYNRSHPSDMPG